jgi:hypothetical protein
MYEKNRIPSFNGFGQVSPSKVKVYWTPSGPMFDEKQFPGGKLAERIAAPQPAAKSNVKLVRDRPSINLSPIEMPTEATFLGLGELAPTKVILPVLGLIIVGFLLYRR